MRRTRILTLVLLLLMLSLAFFVFIKNFNDNFQNYEKIFSIFEKEKTAIIPEAKENNLNYNFKTVSITDDFVPHNIDDIRNIYYTMLNNGWDKLTFYCPKEYENCSDDVTSFADNDIEISLLNNYVSPYNSYKKINTLLNDREVYLSIEKLYSEDEIIYVKNKINELIDLLNINRTNPTIFDIKTIHNYIISNTSYDDNYNKNDTNTVSNKAYGLLKNKIALCSGYSDTLALFLNELNIPNFKVNSEEHVWNVLYINNKWSHIDVTWDDDEIYEDNNYNFFIISTDELLKLDNSKHTFDVSLYKELQ